MAKTDPVIASALQRVGELPDRRTDSSFAALVRIVAGQQLSVKAAATIYGRLEALLGGPPTADNLNLHNDDALRAVGLSRAKVASLRDLSRAVHGGELDIAALASMPCDEVRSQLLLRKGVGPWTVDMVRLFMLGRPDVWPTGDLGVRAGLQRLLNLPERPDAAQAEGLGARWVPHRSGIALLCWRLLHDDGPFDDSSGSSDPVR